MANDRQPIDGLTASLNTLHVEDTEKRARSRRNKQSATSNSKSDPKHQDGLTESSPLLASKWATAHRAQPTQPAQSTITRSQSKRPMTTTTSSPQAYIIEGKQTFLPRPVATKAYHKQVAVPSRQLDQPTALLLVLDVNGTLVRKTSSNAVVPRPFAAQFLKYAMSNHNVVIWSSARPQNVKKRCTKLFEDAGVAMPAIVWDRTHFNLPPELYERNTQVYKRLTQVWDSIELATAFPGKKFDATNTILIDDSVEKAASEPHNLLRVQEFIAGGEDIDELGRVVTYLELARRQSNVSAFIKARPYHNEQHEEVLDWDAIALEDMTRSTNDMHLSKNTQKDHSEASQAQ